MEVRERIALVSEFERGLGEGRLNRHRSEPGIPEPQELEHRVRLFLSEALELCAALGVHVRVYGDDTETDIGEQRLVFEAKETPDLVEAVDALRDLEYTLYGTEATLGVQAASDETFLEVHRSNMAKLESGEVENGKPVKPANWQKPQLAKLLRRRYPKQSLLFRGV